MSMKPDDSSLSPKIGITIYVDGGMVHAVYTTLPESSDVEVEVLDFDNARADGDDPAALDKMREQLATAEKEQRMIF